MLKSVFIASPKES